MLAWEKGWGANKKSSCIGEPLPIFFQCINLVIFFANLGIFLQNEGGGAVQIRLDGLA